MSLTTKPKRPKLRIAVTTEAVRDEIRGRLDSVARDAFDILVLTDPDGDHCSIVKAISGAAGHADFMLITTTDFDRILADVLENIDEDRAATDAYRRTAGEERVPLAVADRLLAGESPIRVWREHRGMTLDQLGTAAGLSKGYLSDLENGKRVGPVETLQAIAHALGVSLDELASGKHRP